MILSGTLKLFFVADFLSALCCRLVFDSCRKPEQCDNRDFSAIRPVFFVFLSTNSVLPANNHPVFLDALRQDGSKRGYHQAHPQYDGALPDSDAGNRMHAGFFNTKTACAQTTWLASFQAHFGLSWYPAATNKSLNHVGRSSVIIGVILLSKDNTNQNHLIAGPDRHICS